MNRTVQFRVEKDPRALLKILPRIQLLADSEKEALGFLPEAALRDAIIRLRLIALMTVQNEEPELAAYVLYGGVYPHAKIQQIATVAKFRKVGAASALIRALASELEREGYMTIKAEVASDLTHALAFYSKHGFDAVRRRAGGQARNRTIVVHVRQLDTESLFSVPPSAPNFEFLPQHRGRSEVPIFAFDLNVYFDLAKDRTHHDMAGRLFGAALGHDIRLAVASEFVVELRRTSAGPIDPILQLALQLPRLPTVSRGDMDILADRLHQIIFVSAGNKGAGSPQALSDARHLAHAALTRAAAFVTRDGPVLAARAALLAEVGIDVIALDELIALLPSEGGTERTPPLKGEGFTTATLSKDELATYLTEVGTSNLLIREFGADGSEFSAIRREAIAVNGRFVAVGAIRIPKGMMPIARMLVHARPEHHAHEMFTDFLVDSLTRAASYEVATAIQLVHIPGQAATNRFARGRGFFRNGTSPHYSKVALGRPLTATNWASVGLEIRRRTGLSISDRLPSPFILRTKLEISLPTGETRQVGPNELEDVLYPTILVWPGRNGVIVPIARHFADELLGTSDQRDLPFMEHRDAAFLSRRGYVNSPRATAKMKPDCPILFYESKRQGAGRGAVVAVARIVDSIVIPKDAFPVDEQRRLVIDDVGSFSASAGVLLTTFDSLLPIPNPISFQKLKEIDAIGRANLISAVSLSSEQLTTILTEGWNVGKIR